MLDCGHPFHPECIKQWLKNSKTCPLCRHKDAYLAKYDIGGNLIWTKNICSGTDTQKGRSITIHDNNDISIIGHFKYEAEFTGITFTSTHRTQFYAKFNSTGDFISARQFECSSKVTNFNNIYNKDTDVFITGFFSDSLFLDNDTIISSGVKDVIILKLNSLNNIVWARVIGNELQNESYGSILYQDNLYLVGSSIGDLGFGLDTIFGNSNYNIFSIKLSLTNILDWYKYYLLPQSGYGININVNNTTGIIGGIKDNSIPYLLYVDYSNGNKLYDETFYVNNNSQNRVSRIIVDNKFNNIITGYFESDTIIISNDTLLNNGGRDVFISKYGCYDLINNFNIIDVSCFSFLDGSIETNILYGNPPYTYLWNTTETTSAIYNLSKGTYTVTISDNCGLTIQDESIVTQPTRLSNNTIITCTPVNECLGIIELQTTGGTLPYEYLWSDGFTMNPNDSLCVGTYYFTITDYNGCVYEKFGKVRNCKSAQIFPNPSFEGNIINIKGVYDIIEVYDILGQKHITQIYDDKIIGLKNGIYFVIIDNKIIDKIIVNK